MVVRRVIYFVSLTLMLSFAVKSSFAELVGYYPMNEGIGTVIADASGYQRHGSTEIEPFWAEGPEGYGAALYFDGSNIAPGCVNCGTWNPSEQTNQLTVAFWVQ
jgi:hypothetical protein